MVMLWTLMARSTRAFSLQSSVMRNTVSAKNSIQSVASHSGLNYGHGRPGMMLFSTASPAELEQLNENIKLKGEEIRQLKADGVDKASIAPRVQELLALKAQLPPVEGEAPKEKPKKDEKPKKAEKKQPAAKKAVVEETLSESELRANRLAKVEAMREAGVEPFEYTYAATHTATELNGLYEGKLEGGEEDESADVSVAGRIMTRRVFGKLAFFTLQDATGTIQLQFDQNRLGVDFQVCMCAINATKT
jgi:beta-glucosidase-like glycosyl hydrolase